MLDEDPHPERLIDDALVEFLGRLRDQLVRNLAAALFLGQSTCPGATIRAVDPRRCVHRLELQWLVWSGNGRHTGGRGKGRTSPWGLNTAEPPASFPPGATAPQAPPAAPPCGGRC